MKYVFQIVKRRIIVDKHIRCYQIKSYARFLTEVFHNLIMNLKEHSC